MNKYRLQCAYSCVYNTQSETICKMAHTAFRLSSLQHHYASIERHLYQRGWGILLLLDMLTINV